MNRSLFSNYRNLLSNDIVSILEGLNASVYDAQTPPTTSDDLQQGFSVGSLWVDVVNEESYICVDNSSGSAVPSMKLPALPAGWLYEGWVAGTEGSTAPISTGTFTSGDLVEGIAAGTLADVTGSDSDQAGPTAGLQIIVQSQHR